jgi:hypothetical protein
MAIRKALVLGADGVPQQVQPADSIAGVVSTVRQLADQTSTTATLANATNLVFAVVAGVTYKFSFNVLFQSTVATVGITLGLTFPSVTIQAATVRIPIAVAGAGGEHQGWIIASGGSVVGSAVPAINQNYLAIVDGVIVPSANGNLQLQFSAETTGATVTLKAGSVGEILVVA